MELDDRTWPNSLFLGMFVFVVALVIICSGVFLMFSGESIAFAAFVMFSGSVALLSSMANLCDAIVKHIKSTGPEYKKSEITQEGVKQLDQISKDCRRIESDAGVPAR